ncbi:MAG: VWA domain-containing protein [Candidatus Coatesbacteria bacterium]|nr:VWA domain-containing protein [Candidatus Coatesbacteria bacterium]
MLIIPLSTYKIIFSVLFLLLLLLLFTLIWSKTKHLMRKWKKFILVSYLLIILALIMSIFTPSILTEKKEYIKEPLIVLIDHSLSMNLSKENFFKKQSLENLLKSKKFSELSQKYDIMMFAFGDSLRSIKSLQKLEDMHSRLEESLGLLEQKKIHSKFVLVISDGWIEDANSSLNYKFFKNKIFALGIGKEPPKSLQIISIKYPENIENEEKIPIIINYYTNGLNKVDFNVLENNQSIKEEIIESRSGFQKHISWVFAPQKGINNYIIRISSDDLNDTRKFTINRGLNKNTIIVAFKELTWETTFFIRYLKRNSIEYEIIDLMQRNNSKINKETMSAIYFGNLESLPVNDFLFSKIFIWPTKGSEILNGTISNKNSLSQFEMDDFIFPKAANITFTASSSIPRNWTPLINVGNIPVLLGMEKTDALMVLFNVQDIWLLQMNEYNEAYEQISNNIVKWLMKPYHPYKWHFESIPNNPSANENFQISVSLTDRKGSLVKLTEIEARIDESKYILSGKNQGVYILNLLLDEGQKNINFTARDSGKEITKASYKIDVLSKHDEKRDLGLNSIKLRNLAGENYFNIENAEIMLDKILDYKLETRSSKKIVDLSPRLYITIIILTLLISIWFIRKVKNL